DRAARTACDRDLLHRFATRRSWRRCERALRTWRTPRWRPRLAMLPSNELSYSLLTPVGSLLLPLRFFQLFITWISHQSIRSFDAAQYRFDNRFGGEGADASDVCYY